MTDQEINVAIAESCGWKRYSPGDFNPTERLEFGPIKGKVVQTSNLPDYCNDLNAMHEAEKNVGSWFEYDRFLCKVSNLSRPIEATARQRAEAYLRAIGKWRE